MRGNSVATSSSMRSVVVPVFRLKRHSYKCGTSSIVSSRATVPVVSCVSGMRFFTRQPSSTTSSPASYALTVWYM